MTEIQDKLLEMLAWYDDFCAQHGLTYYAIGGTLLGAVRHGGFIPWDDDIDVGMPRTDYERFKALMKGASGRYRAETAEDGNRDFTYSFCKLYDTTTTAVCDTRYKIKRGLFIDVFPFDGLGDTKEDALKRFNKIQSKRKMITAKRSGVNKKLSFAMNAAIALAKVVPFSWQKLLKKTHRICAECDFYKSKYVANVFGRWHGREVVEREWLGEPHRYKFETIEISGPADADKYLTSIYGDYMTPPKESDRKPDHECLLLDLNKSYLEE